MPFNPATLIKKKRSGEALTKEEIEFLINGYTKGDVPDYQMSAFLMAVYFKGMNTEETAQLVSVMEHSGDIVDLSKIKAPKLDKHSTGGIGDKTTLILAPLLASCGVVYPSIAGRGLGHTGGTIDKFEAIPGFNCFLPIKRFQELLSTVGVAFIGQTKEICPADRKIYALRDVTATVESVPLIVASIMSKKLAEGIDGIVFDVKCGSGAFMRTEKEAETLSRALVSAAKSAGKLATALITDMNEPLGRTAGNAIEVNECVAFLRQGPQDEKPESRLYDITMALAVELFIMAEVQKGKEPPNAYIAKEILEDALISGKAYSKFLEIVSLQGGDTEALDQGLPLASKKVVFTSAKKGFIQSMNAEAIGLALIELGGGRRKTTDKVDHSVGFRFAKHVGDSVKKDEIIAEIFAKDAKTAELARKMLESAVDIGSETLTKPKLILQKI